MTGQQPIITSGEDRVIKFRPRALARSPRPQSAAANNDAALYGSPLNDRARAKAEVDDYRHRMWMNVAAMVFILMLTGIAVWLAMTISDLRQTQDCLIVGRRDCTRLPPTRTLLPRLGESI